MTYKDGCSGCGSGKKNHFSSDDYNYIVDENISQLTAYDISQSFIF